MRDDGVRVRQIGRVLAGGLQILHQLFGIQPLLRRELLQPRHLGNDHRVRIRKRSREFRLKNIPARRVAARLEDRPDFFARIFQAQRRSVSRMAVG
jgi:hypothetical protein